MSEFTPSSSSGTPVPPPTPAPFPTKGWTITALSRPNCTSLRVLGPPPQQKYEVIKRALKANHFTFLHQHVFSRFFEPQGPLCWADLTSVSQLDTLLRSCKSPNTPSSPSRPQFPLIRHELNILAQQALSKSETSSSTWSSPPPIADDAMQVLQDGQLRPDKPGQLLFRANLIVEEGSIFLALSNFRACQSCRFSREFGAENILRVTIAAADSSATEAASKVRERLLRAFLQKPIMILDRSYRSFFWEEEKGVKTVVYVEGNLVERVRGHIDFRLRKNKALTFAKFQARFKLGLSSSTPSVIFDRSQVTVIPDLQADTLEMSHAFMAHIAQKLSLPRIPTAIEGVVDGDPHTWTCSTPSPDGDLWIEAWDDALPNIPQLSIRFTVHNLSGTAPVHFKYNIGNWQKSSTLRVKQERPPRGKIMSDGIGRCSVEVAAQVRQDMGLQLIPTAFQCRIGLAKGMLKAVPREHSSPGMWVELRPSQIKAYDASSKTFTLEILRVPKEAAPSSLSYQFSMALAHGGVPLETFEQLVRSVTETLSTAVLASLEHPALASSHLFHAARLGPQRDAVFQRELGFGTRSQISDALDSSNISARRDCWSGAATSLAERTVEALNAGVALKTDCSIAGDFKALSEFALLPQYTKAHVPVPLSAHLMLTIDEAGVLGPFEIAVHFSNGFLDDTTGYTITQLEGDVLISRSPCVLPTDVQKVRAVYLPALQEYKNQIIVSRRGHRSLAELLAGGDFDGDSATVIFDPDIVAHFQNSDEKFADQPFKDEAYFEIDTSTVGDVLSFLLDSELRLAEPFLMEQKLSEALMSGLWNHSRFAQVNVQWQASAYWLGLADRTTILLGHLFNRLLDGQKQGLTVSDKIMASLETMMRKPNPYWKVKLDLKGDENGTKLPKKVGGNVMDFVVDLGEHLVDEFRLAWNARTEHLPVHADPDLIAPFFNELDAAYKGSQRNAVDDLVKIAEHVSKCWELAKDTLPDSKSPTRAMAPKDSSKALIAVRRDESLSSAIWDVGVLRDSLSAGCSFKQDAARLRRLVASCVYAFGTAPMILGLGQHGGPFFFWRGPRAKGFNEKDMAFSWAWRYAHRDLCAIKAAAENGKRYSAADGQGGFPGLAISESMGLVLSIAKGPVARLKKRLATKLEGGDVDAELDNDDAHGGPASKRTRLQ